MLKTKRGGSAALADNTYSAQSNGNVNKGYSSYGETNNENNNNNNQVYIINNGNNSSQQQQQHDVIRPNAQRSAASSASSNRNFYNTNANQASQLAQHAAYNGNGAPVNFNLADVNYTNHYDLPPLANRFDVKSASSPQPTKNTANSYHNQEQKQLNIKSLKNLNSSASLANSLFNNDSSVNNLLNIQRGAAPPRSARNHHSKSALSTPTKRSLDLNSSPNDSLSSANYVESSVCDTLCSRNCLVGTLICIALLCIIGIVTGVTFIIINLDSQQLQESHTSSNKEQLESLLKQSGFKNNTHLVFPNNEFDKLKYGPNYYASTTSSAGFRQKPFKSTPTPASSSCGRQTTAPFLERQQYARIINGNEAVPHSWPWIASIAFYGPKSSLPHACGAALINRRYLVTATHCVLKSTIFNLVGRPQVNSTKYGSLEKMMRVYIGIHRRSSDIGHDTTYYAEKIISYPNFNTGTFQNDLTVIRLTRDVYETDKIGYLCLTRNTNIHPGVNVYAIGWGYTLKNFKSASDRLNQVSFNVQSFARCGLNYIPSMQFCAGNPQARRDTCNGDSGGPIMRYMDYRWHLAGIVSNGDAICTGKGIYTNIAHYYDWLAQQTEL